MATTTSHVQVHLLDPVPGVVLTKICEGLRAIGIDPELLRGDLVPRRRPGSAARLVLTRRAPEVALDDNSAVVTLPAVPRTARLDRLVAEAMLARVLRTLRGLMPNA